MKRSQRGVTLIELMVVVMIVGLLMAIAVPSYRQYIIRSNRSTAKVMLTQTAMNLERCYTNSTPYAYDSAVCAAAVTFPVPSNDGTYTITAVTAAQTYTLTATPQGTQAQDTKCANFTLNQAGVQTISGTSTLAQCWRK